MRSIDITHSARVLFTIAAVGVALAVPFVSRTESGDLQLAPKESKDMIVRLQAARDSNAQPAGMAPAASLKFNGNHMLRLVDAVNTAFDDRRRKYGDVRNSPIRSSFESKYGTKPLLSVASIERPAWITPDRRVMPVFPFVVQPA